MRLQYGFDQRRCRLFQSAPNPRDTVSRRARGFNWGRPRPFGSKSFSNRHLLALQREFALNVPARPRAVIIRLHEAHS
jgi:hypothetical protein